VGGAAGTLAQSARAEPEPDGARHGLAPALDVERAVDADDVVAHGRDAVAQGGGDLPVRLAGDEPSQDLDLALAEPEGGEHGRSPAAEMRVADRRDPAHAARVPDRLGEHACRVEAALDPGAVAVVRGEQRELGEPQVDGPVAPPAVRVDDDAAGPRSEARRQLSGELGVLERGERPRGATA
jgi:hypothetical protein